MLFLPPIISFCLKQVYLDILERTNMIDAKEVSTLMACSTSLIRHDGSKAIDAICYYKVVGNLIYLSLTHPDIAYAAIN